MISNKNSRKSFEQQLKKRQKLIRLDAFLWAFSYFHWQLKYSQKSLNQKLSLIIPILLFYYFGFSSIDLISNLQLMPTNLVFVLQTMRI